jgi:hypothetical protein
MTRLLLALLLLATPAFSNDTFACKSNPDRLTVEDDGPGRVVVSYHNSIDGCSSGFNEVFTTEAGVVLRVVVDVNVDENGSKERVTVVPETDGYLAFPPEVELEDGQNAEILVLAGMA